jgi:FkbM family methyltransferase
MWGANLRQMTVLFAKAVPSGHVVDFEADRYIAHLLRLNVEFNRLTSVAVIEGAVGTRSASTCATLSRT